MGTRMCCVPSMSPHAGSMDVKSCEESGRRSSEGTRIARRSLMHFERRNVMNKRLGSILFVSCCLSVVPAWAQPQAGAQPRSGAQLQGDSETTLHSSPSRRGRPTRPANSTGGGTGSWRSDDSERRPVEVQHGLLPGDLELRVDRVREPVWRGWTNLGVGNDPKCMGWSLLGRYDKRGRA